jgi:hypothetical protein
MNKCLTYQESFDNMRKEFDDKVYHWDDKKKQEKDKQSFIILQSLINEHTKMKQQLGEMIGKLRIKDLGLRHDDITLEKQPRDCVVCDVIKDLQSILEGKENG